MSKPKLLIVYAILLLSLAMILVGCSKETLKTADSLTYDTGLSAKENSNLAFKDLFPLHYESYLKNNDDTQMTEYGGSVPHAKHDGVSPLPEGYKHAQPYLKNLWLGYPFSYQYDRARGPVSYTHLTLPTKA